MVVGRVVGAYVCVWGGGGREGERQKEFERSMAFVVVLTRFSKLFCNDFFYLARCTARCGIDVLSSP